MALSRKEWDDSDYLLIVSGQMRSAPFLAGWQDFKDHIRNYVKEQPGWVEVRNGKRRGEKESWVKLQDPADVDPTYRAYSAVRGVFVHVFKTSRRSGQFDLIRCNCTLHFSDARGGHSPNRSGIDVGGVNQYFGKPCAAMAPQYMVPAQPTYAYGSYYQTGAYATPAVYSYPAAPMQTAAPQMPAYSQSTGGLPVNVGQGAMLTEARGIFIQGLNYNVGNSELTAFIQAHGLRPSETKVHKDSRGQSKGFATAKFGTKQEAQWAIHLLHGKYLNEKVLSVRMDTDTTVVGQLDPLVVDSSMYQG